MATAKIGSPFFSTGSQQFLDLRQSELRQSTAQRFYKPAFKSFLSVIPDKPIQQYSPLDIAVYQQIRVKAGIQPTTVNIPLRGLKALGNWLVEMELLPEKNPFSRIQLFKQGRKSFGSWLLASGVGTWHVSKLLTHSRVEVTQKYYAGVSIEDLNEQVQKLPSFL